MFAFDDEPAKTKRLLGCKLRRAVILFAIFLFEGCASVRERADSTDLKPCRDAIIRTRDGWLLGVRHYRPANPAPSKLPVVLCHGLGLNATFWTITDNHLPQQLNEAGYDVFVYDCRGSGDSTPENYRRLNKFLRNTIIPERGERSWTTDDQAFYDIPAVLDHVRQVTGKDQVNWVGHSLGGMLMFTFLELHPDRHRIANFVGMGSTAVVMPTRDSEEMSRANRGLRTILSIVSTSRIARPMRFGRPPGLAYIDRFYYTRDNVDSLTVDRFYGYTLEDPGQAALFQLQPYLTEGRFESADGTVDYSAHLDLLVTPTLFIAGEGDVMADIPSKTWTFDRIAAPDKTMIRFGKKYGHELDYGHCDLVWARSAPQEIFPEVIRWLDARQPGLASSQTVPSPQSARANSRISRAKSPEFGDQLPVQVVIGEKQVKIR